MEVTFQKLKGRLRFLDAAAWARAIRRTVPALLGLFSLLARLRTGEDTDHGCHAKSGMVRQSPPTFSDALALVRKGL